MTEILQEGIFDRQELAEELVEASSNVDVGTALLFENDRVRVWEVRLDPGVRCPFHAHTRPYFWTCVEAGVAKQRSPDGTWRVRRYASGETLFGEHSEREPMLHDLENVGDSVLRFVTVELLG